MTPLRSQELDVAALRREYRFAELVRPHVGLMEHVTFLPVEMGEVDLEVAATGLDNLTMTFPHVTMSDGRDVREEAIGGASADVDARMSWVRAVVEGAERYSSMAYAASDFVVATASELGRAALDLSRIPRCSQDEYADPSCPLRPPRDDVPIRWVRGISMIDGADRYVPAIMVHLHLKPWPGERFWLPISTGVAAHTCLEAALNAAICEGIERDALALTWLLRLELPRIEHPPRPPAALADLLERLSQSKVEHLAFDATTDLGIPTVFGVQVTDGHPSCELFVSCATALNAEVAFGKAIREASPARAVLEGAPTCPPSFEDFNELTHGASYYGRGGHRQDFEFLLGTRMTTSLAGVQEQGSPPRDSDESACLRFLVERLRMHGMEAIAIDLTADEVRDAGLWVVRVVIAELVPISFVHRARFLGTPRLLDYARRRGAAPGVSPRFNPNPLPFA